MRPMQLPQLQPVMRQGRVHRLPEAPPAHVQGLQRLPRREALPHAQALLRRGPRARGLPQGPEREPAGRGPRAVGARAHRRNRVPEDQGGAVRPPHLRHLQGGAHAPRAHHPALRQLRRPLREARRPQARVHGPPAQATGLSSRSIPASGQYSWTSSSDARAASAS